jgi:gas vesicle protein
LDRVLILFTIFTIFSNQGDDIMATKKRTTNYNPLRLLIGLLVGGLAGVVTMLLFAPQSGKQTRDQIEEKTIELRDQTSKNVKKALAQVRSGTVQIKSDVQEKASELKQLGQDKLVEQLDRVSAALDTGKTAVEAA